MKFDPKLGLITCILFVVSAFAVAMSDPKPVMTLKATRMPAVNFPHKVHMGLKAGCESCHHKSKPEKPATDEYAKCSQCHAEQLAAPMKTSWAAAFHNATATKGTCIDCHKAEKAKDKDKKIPTQCKECHAGEKKG